MPPPVLREPVFWCRRPTGGHIHGNGIVGPRTGAQSAGGEGWGRGQNVPGRGGFLFPAITFCTADIIHTARCQGQKAVVAFNCLGHFHSHREGASMSLGSFGSVSLGTGLGMRGAVFLNTKTVGSTTVRTSRGSY